MNVGTGSGTNGSLTNLNGDFSRVDSWIKLNYIFDGYASGTPPYDILSEQKCKAIPSQFEHI
jgi:hypothetical protein